MYYLTPLACSIWIIAVATILLRRVGRAWIYHVHFVLFTCFFFLTHLGLPVLQQYIGIYRYSGDYSLAAHSTVFLAATLFWTFVLFGYYFALRGRLAPSVNIAEIDIHRGYGLLILAIVFAVGVAASASILRGIYAVGVDRYFSDRLSYQSFGGLVLLAHWVYAVCIGSFYISINSNASRAPNVRRLARLLFVFSLAYSVLYYGLNGNRNSIFLLVVTLLGVWALVRGSRAKRIPWLTLGSLSLMMIVGFSMLGHLRGNQYRLDSMFEFRQDAALSVVRSLNGAFGNNENCLWLVDHPQPLLLGSTYLAGVVNFVPRAVWPEKPVGAGPVMRNYIHPGSYVIGARGNSSYTTGILNELQMNFGLMGAILISPFLGLLFGLMTRAVFQSRMSSRFLLGITALILMGTLFVYGEFLGSFWRWVFTLMPLIMLTQAPRVAFIAERERR